MPSKGNIWSKGNIFNWRVGEEELQQQVAQYDILKIYRSYKGISALLLLSTSIVTVVGWYLSWVHEDAIYGLVIYVPLAFFVYKGYRWALVAAMVLWTFEKGYQIFNNPNELLMHLVWWTIYMKAFYGAWKIEKARRWKTITASKPATSPAAR